jgi:hypothetical protein
MTNDERFELMWNHYHKQIDENRAVSRALDNCRERIEKAINDNEELTERCNKMSFLLGMGWSFIAENRETFKQHGMSESDSCKQGYESFTKGIEELFYSGKV